MNKRINFEDNMYVISLRIKMIRDLMKLDTDGTLFYKQTMNDLEFIDSSMNMLSEKFLNNLKILERDAEADNILAVEWDFGQILNQISNNSNLFAPVDYPEMPTLIANLRKNSAKREKQIEDSYVPAEHSMSERTVSKAEITGLLGSS
ncbi:MAG: hypothetical protein FWB73_00730 [Treponema sp.]|nr:hypothetical protein [Treponema sp.]